MEKFEKLIQENPFSMYSILDKNTVEHWIEYTLTHPFSKKSPIFLYETLKIRDAHIQLLKSCYSALKLSLSRQEDMYVEIRDIIDFQKVSKSAPPTVFIVIDQKAYDMNTSTLDVYYKNASSVFNTSSFIYFSIKK